MQIYYVDARLNIVEDDGKYNIFDKKYNRETHKNVDKEWTDNFINRVLSKRKKTNKRRKKVF